MKDLKYPHFLKCIEFTDDIYWRNIFEELAFGIPPYNTFIRKEYLISNIKNKEFNYKIDKDEDSKKVFNDLYDILYNKFGLISDIQIKEDEISFENHNKKKTLKYSVIEEYCNSMRQKHDLSTSITKKLLNYINLSLTIRNIIPDNIIYDDNGYIIEIEGIEFKDSDFFVDDMLINSNYINNDTIVDYEYMYNNWNKYLNNLIK